jgi:hypothetical protein
MSRSAFSTSPTGPARIVGVHLLRVVGCRDDASPGTVVSGAAHPTARRAVRGT